MQRKPARIKDLLQQARPLLSVEFFPPKNEEGARQILRTAKSLQPLNPDFVSITYGAGGGTRERTLAYGELLQDIFDFEVMPHLTCVGHSKAELQGIIAGFEASGFGNIMALRGDPPKGQTDFTPHPDGLRYGSELVRFIREKFPEMGIGVGGYPEKHPDADSLQTDIAWLKHKVEQGADFITTQLFFDNTDYFRFVEKLQAEGVSTPVIPGILPALSAKQLERLVTFCDAALPEALMDQLRAVGDDEATAREIGVNWAYEQIADLLRQGAPGVHLYIMNRYQSPVDVITRLQNEGLLSGRNSGVNEL